MAHWSADRLAVPRIRWRKPSSVARMIVSTDSAVPMSSGRFAEDRPAEQRLVLVRGLQRGEQAEQGEGGHRPSCGRSRRRSSSFAQASTPSVPAAMTSPTNTSQVIRRRGMIRCSFGRGGTSMRPSRGLP